MEKDVVMDIEEIKKYIPHRYPFLFVDIRGNKKWKKM